MIDLLGLLIFATVVGIGLLDASSGLGPFAVYRPVGMSPLRRQASESRGDDNQPTPPAPAQ